MNLRDKKNRFISKGWKTMSTHRVLSERLHLPCMCGKEVIHAPCEGNVIQSTAMYTPEFAKRVCQVILKHGDESFLVKDLQGKNLVGDHFGLGSVCACHEVRFHGMEVPCGSCSQAFQHEHHACTADNHDAVLRRPLSDEEIRRRLYLLHSSTGHGPVTHLLQALKRKNVAPRILELAKDFKCSVCDERRRPQPRNLSSLEPLPPRFETLSADIGHWIHPVTHEKWQFVMMVDEGSRYRVARMILHGKQKHVSASQFISVLQESWVSYFGYPRTLRVDPDGAFRSHELATFCDQQQIFLDIIPGEAHWKLSVCERSIQAAKHVMECLASEDTTLTAEQILAEAIRTLNHREVVRGYSPVQFILGRAPDEHGRFYSPARDVSTHAELPMATETMERDQNLRLKAEKSFLDWIASERIQRATHSKHRRILDFSAGDLVFVWRKQLTGEDAKQNKTGQGRFVGPARILATENTRDENGHLKAGSSVWLVRGRRLIKCCPEQLRHASERETLLTELHDPREVPRWDFPIVAEEVGKQ